MNKLDSAIQTANYALSHIKGTIDVLDSIYINIDNDIAKEIIVSQSILLKSALKNGEQQIQKIKQSRK